MNKLTITLVSILCINLVTHSDPLTTGASLAKSGLGIAIKGISKSLTSTSAGASSTCDTTSSRKKEDPYVLNLDFLNAPKLYTTINSEDDYTFDKSIKQSNQSWLLSQLLNIGFPYHKGTLKVTQNTHTLQKRRNLKVLLINNTLHIDPEIITEKKSELIKEELAYVSWKFIGKKNRDKYKTICGWKASPFMPLISVNSFNAKEQNSLSPKEDYIKALLNDQTKTIGSRTAYINQLKGELKNKVNPILDEYKVNFCFIEDKGFAGASQGHCALVLETPEGKKLSFSYTADFDFSSPLTSASKALFGALPRTLHCIEYGDLKRIYKEENRETLLQPLNLSRQQKNDLLFRVRECFEFENGKYSFLRQNCANPLRDILIYSFPEDKKLRGWKTPLTLWDWSKNGIIEG
jgi:hypothetical protein